MEVVIDSMVSTAAEEDESALSPEDVLNNVLEELKHCTASVMQHRKSSVVLEKLARRANAAQLRLMLHRCATYTLSLANNRYMVVE